MTIPAGSVSDPQTGTEKAWPAGHAGLFISYGGSSGRRRRMRGKAMSWRVVRRAMPRRKYGHLRVSLGKKPDERGAVAGCPKCARGMCSMHM